MERMGILIVLLITFFIGDVFAEDFGRPSGVPEPTMVTIKQIYEKLDSKIGPSSFGLPLKTGQTSSARTNDDASYQKGVEIPTPRFIDNSNGTVTDNLTGLVWLKNGKVSGLSRTWATALLDVKQLNTDGTMGGNNCGDTSNEGSHQSDWRLPNINELESLIDYSNRYPSLTTGHPFILVGGRAHYWSSTNCVKSPDYSWCVAIGDPYVEPRMKTWESYVLPVRGGSN